MSLDIKDKQGCHIEVVNIAEEDKAGLMQDLISIITSCGLYIMNPGEVKEK